MMRPEQGCVKVLLSVLVMALGMSSPAWAELKTRTVDYQSGDTVLEGYLAYDDSFSGKRPGVLVAHEWTGLNDYARARADMLAGLGYVAFAADIYGKGVRPQTTEAAAAESAKFKDDRALLRKRAVAGLDVLRAGPNVDPGRLAAIGYCFGGTTVLELARSGADLEGVVSFHGGLGSPAPQDAGNIRARVLILHGADDPFVPQQEVDGFETEMHAAHIPYQLIVYPGAVHGFTNPANTGAVPGALYNAAADQESWQAMEEFLKKIFASP